MLFQRHEKSWDALSPEEKMELLRSDITKLFDIDEEFTHKDHVFADAISLVHTKLNALSKTIEKLEKRIEAAELTDY